MGPPRRRLQLRDCDFFAQIRRIGQDTACSSLRST